MSMPSQFEFKTPECLTTQPRAQTMRRPPLPVRLTRSACKKEYYLSGPGITISSRSPMIRIAIPLFELCIESTGPPGWSASDSKHGSTRFGASRVDPEWAATARAGLGGLLALAALPGWGLRYRILFRIFSPKTDMQVIMPARHATKFSTRARI
jgi:hypothetical protein